MGSIRSSLTGSRGILNPGAVGQAFQLTRTAPSADLRPWVERYWRIVWDLPEQQRVTQDTLPYPCVNLVFERGNTHIWGVTTGKFTRHLEGRGQVFAIKFKPASFYPFLHRPLTTLTNGSLPFIEVFGSSWEHLEASILRQEHEAAMVALVEQFLRSVLPPPDAHATEVNQIVEAVAEHREITRVDDLAAHSGRSVRTLQRLFRQYVGVSPKWVIQRYRLQEVAERLDRGEHVKWPSIVLELGYSDQAHFIKDFKAIVGQTPLEYARTCAQPRREDFQGPTRVAAVSVSRETSR